MRSHRSNPRGLFYRPNVVPFLTVMMVLLMATMVEKTSFSIHHGLTTTLPRGIRAIPLPGAVRYDAMIVVVRRDGQIYFGSEQVAPDHLPVLIQDRLRDGSPRKVFIEADARVRYETVQEVLDGIRLAGIQNISFYAR